MSGITDNQLKNAKIDAVALSEIINGNDEQDVGRRLAPDAPTIDKLFAEIRLLFGNLTFDGIACQPMAANSLVTVYTENGIKYIKLANSSTTQLPAIAYINRAYQIGDTVKCFVVGILRGQTGLIRGQRYYLGVEDYTLVTIPPEAPGTIRQLIGTAISETELIFQFTDYSIN